MQHLTFTHDVKATQTSRRPSIKSVEGSVRFLVGKVANGVAPVLKTGESFGMGVRAFCLPLIISGYSSVSAEYPVWDRGAVGSNPTIPTKGQFSKFIKQSQTRGQWFESTHPTTSGVAQLAEHRFRLTLP